MKKKTIIPAADKDKECLKPLYKLISTRNVSVAMQTHGYLSTQRNVFLMDESMNSNGPSTSDFISQEKGKFSSKVLIHLVTNYPEGSVLNFKIQSQRGTN